MKGKVFKYFWLTLGFSLLPLLAIFFNPLMPHTHDGPVHLARMAAWYKAFKDGQLPPRWAADLNYGYGTPVLIFMYPWPYLLGTGFLSLGFGLVWSFKLVLALSFLLAGVFMFLFAKTLFKDFRVAFLLTLLYQFASFRLIEMMVRGALGEVWTYAFVPLAMLGLIKIFRGERIPGFLLSGLGTGLLVLSHNSISLSFFITLLLFALLFGKNLLNYFWGLVSLLFGLGLAAFYWLPALWERKYTYGDLFMRELYLQHFPTLKQLFWPNLLNHLSGQVHDIAVQIGVIHLLSLAVAVFLLFRGRLKETEKKLVVFALIVFLASLFFMQSISIPLWQKLSWLRQFQFSWRLLSLVTLVTALSGFSLFKILPLKRRRVLGLATILVLLLSCAYWWPMLGFDQVNEANYWSYPLSTTYFGEADTIWAAHPPERSPEKRIQIVEGKGEIRGFVQNSVSQRFLLRAKTEVNVLSRTLFFPGWRVFVKDKQVPIEFQDQNYRGLITFRLPAGEHEVEVKFGRTKDRTGAEIISLGSLTVLLSLTTLTVLQKHKKWLGSYRQ